MIFAIGRNHEEFMANSIDDIPSLPSKVEMGSACLVIDTGEIYLYNGTEWQLFADGGSTPGGGDVKFCVVDELPATGTSNLIYLVLNTEAESEPFYDKYIWINGKWESLTSKCVIPDWNVNDENTDGYIKNRTHYDMTKRLVILDEPITFDEYSDGGTMYISPQYYYNKDVDFNDLKAMLTENTKVIVTFSDRVIEYENVTISEGSGSIVFTTSINEREYGGYIYPTKQIQCYYYLGFLPSGSWENITINKIEFVNENIKTLEPKYLAKGGNEGDVLTKTADGMEWKSSQTEVIQSGEHIVGYDYISNKDIYQLDLFIPTLSGIYGTLIDLKQYISNIKSVFDIELKELSGTFRRGTESSPGSQFFYSINGPCGSKQDGTIFYTQVDILWAEYPVTLAISLINFTSEPGYTCSNFYIKMVYTKK